jgi:hypothetical protein
MIEVSNLALEFFEIFLLHAIFNNRKVGNLDENLEVTVFDINLIA